jgi:serine/threonine-protein kinase
MGTVQYLAPEQATGKPATPSTDIYSLGIVAYEALTGRRPFTGESQMVIAMAQINDKPPAIGDDIDKRVQELVLSCLAKKPNQRPGSALDLSNRARALRLQLEGVSATEVFDPQSAPVTRVNDTAIAPETEPLAKLPVVWPWLALIGVLVVAAGGVMIAIIVSLVSEQSPSPSPSSVSVSKRPTEPAPDRPAATVSIFLTDVVGKKVLDATTFLTQKGLLVEAVAGEALDPSDPRILDVYQAEGLGQVAVGSTVRIFYYIQGEPAPVPTPSPTVSQSPSPSPTVTPSPSPSSSGGG